MNAATLLKKQYPNAELLRVGTMGDFDLDMKDGSEPNSWMIKDGKVVPVDYKYLMVKSFGPEVLQLLKA